MDKDSNLEQSKRILLVEVYVDHLEERLHFFVGHLSILVQICLPQVAMYPGESNQGLTHKSCEESNWVQNRFIRHIRQYYGLID